jgi:hypothetical protein
VTYSTTYTRINLGMNITILITFIKGQFYGKNVKPLQFSIRLILNTALHKRRVIPVLSLPSKKHA